MNHVTVLGKLGLSEYESRAYVSLAKLGPSTIKRIVADSNLPRNKAYEALQKLEFKNLAQSLPVHPRKYQLINHGLLEDQVEDMSNSVQELIKLIQSPKEQHPEELFWVLKSKAAIIEMLSEENNSAKSEVLMCTRLSTMHYKNMRTIGAAVKRGVNFKIICIYNPAKKEIYQSYLALGAKIRIFNSAAFGQLLPRLSVFDGRKARLTIGRPEVNSDEEYLSILTESKAFCNMVRNYFLSMWGKCKPLESYLKQKKQK